MKIKAFILAMLAIFVFSVPLLAQVPLNRVICFDLNLTHYLEVKWNEDDTSNRVLSFSVNGADRTIDLSGNLTLSGANTVATWTVGTTLTMSAASHLVLPLENDAATPTFAFGDGNTGLYESADNRLNFAVSGSWRFEMSSTYFKANNGAAILCAASSATVPCLVPRENDDNSGIGWAGVDTLSLIAGGVEGIRITEDTTILVDLKGEVNSVSHYGTMQTATGDGTTTVDWGLGNIMYFTFGAANETFTFTAPANKGKVTLILKQDGVGSRTATWPGTVDWPGAVAPTLTTTAAAVDIVTFIYDGTNWLGLFNGDFR